MRRLAGLAGVIADLLARRIPDVKPIVFDWPPEREQAANLRAELATRGEYIDGRTVWDESIPYTLTEKATA